MSGREITSRAHQENATSAAFAFILAAASACSRQKPRQCRTSHSACTAHQGNTTFLAAASSSS
eukprot:2181336-Rhodomonas_salina.1